MRLITLRLENFKGIRSFTLDANGMDCSVFGNNATGKTSLYDAFLYLLFGKDSQNKKDFAIKTLTPEGDPIHNLQHEVEASFDINGKVVTLRKVYKEVWKKTRGKSKAEFDGHTTDYYIDGVPKPLKDYNAFIISIINENLFKLLTNPLAFNENIKWEDRRKILLQVCGDISDEDVISSDKELKKLPDILQGRAVEDHKKVIAARRAEINKELERIPIRIDEVNKSMPDVSGISSQAIAQRITLLTADIKTKEQEIARIESGGEVAEKTKRLREIEGELLKLANDHRDMVDQKVDGRRKDLNDTKGLLNDSLAEESSLRLQQININKQINSLRDKRSELALEWKQVNGLEFEYEQDDVCPACGQALPSERLQAAREKALEQFNLKKSLDLEKINSDGQEIKEKLTTLNQELTELTQKILTAEQSTTTCQTQISDIEMDIISLTANMGKPEDMPEYSSKFQEKESIQKEITDLQTGTQDAFDTAHRELDQLSNDLMAVQKSKLQMDQYQQGQERIKELEQQEKDLSAEHEKLEAELSLVEQFVRSKVSLLEDRINSKFKMARFTLFETQINGGQQEVCKTTFNGVPYSEGLNNAARINVGLDIIRTISDHYNFHPVVFIDNAEAVVELIPMKAQVIRLVVSEPDKKLRVEVPNNKGGNLFE